MANYPMPSWLEPKPPTGADYAQGFSVGANVAVENARINAQAREAQARLAQQAYMADLESKTQLEVADRRARMEAQRIEIDREYKNAVVGLQEQRIQGAARAAQQKNKLAADRFMTQQEYTRRVSSGEDPAKVMLELGPQMGASMGGMASLVKTTQPKPTVPEAVVTEFEGQKFLKVPTTTGAFRYQKIDEQLGQPEEVSFGGEKYLKIPQGTGKYSYQRIPGKTATAAMLPEVRARMTILGSEKRTIEGKYTNPIIEQALKRTPVGLEQWNRDQKRLKDIENELLLIAPQVTNRVAAAASSIGFPAGAPETNAPPKKRFVFKDGMLREK